MTDFAFEPSGMASASKQDKNDRDNRRATLVNALEHVRRRELGAPGLVELVESLGLDDEMDRLANSSPERLARWQQVRADRTVD